MNKATVKLITIKTITKGRSYAKAGGNGQPTNDSGCFYEMEKWKTAECDRKSRFHLLKPPGRISLWEKRNY